MAAVKYIPVSNTKIWVLSINVLQTSSYLRENSATTNYKDISFNVVYGNVPVKSENDKNTHKICVQNSEFINVTVDGK